MHKFKISEYTMTKKELHSTVTQEVKDTLNNVLANIEQKATKKDLIAALEKQLITVLDTYLAPKRNVSEYEDFTENGITYHYCMWHKEYHPITEFNTKNGKAVHECKEAVKEWHKYANVIKKLKALSTNILDDVLSEKLSASDAKAKRDNIVSDIKLLEDARSNKYNFDDFINSIKDNLLEDDALLAFISKDD